MKRIIIFMLIFFSLVPSVYPRGIGVGPELIEVDVLPDSHSTTTIYVTSFDFDGEVKVGTENLPFEISPKSFHVSDGFKNEPIVLAIHGNDSLKDSLYSGKLTFLGDAKGNIATGVKVKTTINQFGGGNKNTVIAAISALALIVLAFIIKKVLL